MRESVTGKVLVVDDEESNRNLFRDLLTSAGHDVVLAADGREAIALIKSGKPDVMLLDLVMPGRDGFELCRLVRVDYATAALPILIITGLDDRDARLRGIRCGANDFITKPIDIEDTLLRVENALRFQRSVANAREEERIRVARILEEREELMALLRRDCEPLAAALGDTIEILATCAPENGPPEQALLIDRGRQMASQLIGAMRSAM